MKPERTLTPLALAAALFASPAMAADLHAVDELSPASSLTRSDSQGSLAMIDQRGRNNHATVVQSGAGNDARVRQMGGSHEGTIVQYGVGHQAGLDQAGYGKQAFLRQTGVGGHLHVDQRGNGSASPVQVHQHARGRARVQVIQH